MFTTKKETLLTAPQTSGVTAGSNGFIKEACKIGALTRSENGAVKYSTTGDDFVDQFGNLGAYKTERSFSDISRDMSTLWAQDPEKALRFTLFLRMVTRVVKFSDGSRTSSTQRGSGLKHEGIMRMIWIHINHKDVFWNNIELYISLASWRDIFEMLRYDLQYNGWEGRLLNWELFGKLILAGLENDETSDLVKKYMPTIKTRKDCTTIETQSNTIIGKWLCSLIFGQKEDGSATRYKQYRQLKTSGQCHKWQQLISKQLFTMLDFDSVHGRALALMVSSKFLKNNGLESKYEQWIDSKPVAKFTGYPHELFNKVGGELKPYQIKTLNAQFNSLVETAKKSANSNTGLIVVRDTSQSMSSQAIGCSQSCYAIAKALALFFSKMLPDGAFANHWIEFNSTAQLQKWTGSSPYENYVNDRSSYVGSTNFMSVIYLFCEMKRKGIPESEFPSGILCISDMEFDPASLNKTNVETIKTNLRFVGFSEEYVSNFKVVLWNLRRGNPAKYETHGKNGANNVFYFGGYDGSIISFLTGSEQKEQAAPKTARELFDQAMKQESLDYVIL